MLSKLGSMVNINLDKSEFVIYSSLTASIKSRYTVCNLGLINPDHLKNYANLQKQMGYRTCFIDSSFTPVPGADTPHPLR